MFSQLQTGPLNAGGDRTQDQDDRGPNAVDQETSVVSCGVTGEQLLQWQQRVTSTRQGKEDKLRKDKLVVESSGR